MDDRWGPDPTQQLWARWRRPLLAVAGIVLVAGQWERLSSGHPFAVATGVGLACFWVSLLVRRSAPPPEERTDADAWRRHARRSAVFFGSWAVAAWGWLALGAHLYTARPANLVGPSVPTLLALLQLWTHRHAERLARIQAGAEVRGAGRPGAEPRRS